MDSVATVTRSILGVLGLFLFPYGLICLILALRHRLPGIDVAWVFKTRLSAANFDDRGKTLRERGVNALLAWLIVFVCLSVFAIMQTVRR